MELIEPLDATSIRDLYFKQNVNMNFIRSVVPAPAYVFLDNWTRTTEYAQIIREREFIETYKKQYSNLPYPPIFVTTDAVVIQAGNVLMIKRRSEPGKGLWALPGGFVNADTDKSLEDAMLRELSEETGIKVPEKVLRGSIQDYKVFDAIGRSARGRTITHAFKILLTDGEWNLPKVKGADDAEKAEWIPIGQLESEMCFEDHWEIIQHFLGA
jgi:bifunctional NMN adenylyltransferase/nudix hydrolase